jgi:broad specificity phosphatase PhoE
MLKDTPIREVIATDAKRTQQMAEPTAKEHGTLVRVIPKQDADGLLRAVRAQLGNALVVGHSDTLPKVLRELTGKDVGASVQFAYDEMFVVPVVEGKVGGAVVMHYCAPADNAKMKP